MPGAAAAGWRDQCWTLARIVEVVHRRFRVEYTLAGMDLLHPSAGACRRRATAPSPSVRLLPRAPSQPALQRAARHLRRCDPYPICRRHRS
ncbi:winged helix-turn-helix domain-containing protein [Streptomyces sp. NPDC058695]|uniref:winged helix-turn-helix domain-containing protein n=1 Tax=Streptomyces sp. NPDC058695 TaxID=3346604 RepID=UPI00365D150C